MPAATEIETDPQPTDDYFDLMAGIAGRHWWYRARRAWVLDQLVGRLAEGSTVVDVGTGTGETLHTLRAAGAGRVVGTDLSVPALRYASRGVPAAPLLRCRAEQVPLRSAVADALVSLDVVEHLDDDVRALVEYRRVLRPGGLLLVTVPAYAWLWSEHDVRAAHRRRYTRARLLDAVGRAGFEPLGSTYLFSFLVPPAAVLRRTPVGRWLGSTDDEVSSLPAPVEAVLARLADAERWTARRVPGGIPAGLSVLCLARSRRSGAA